VAGTVRNLDTEFSTISGWRHAGRGLALASLWMCFPSTWWRLSRRSFRWLATARTRAATSTCSCSRSRTVGCRSRKSMATCSPRSQLLRAEREVAHRDLVAVLESTRFAALLRGWKRLLRRRLLGVNSAPSPSRRLHPSMSCRRTAGSRRAPPPLSRMPRRPSCTGCGSTPRSSDTSSSSFRACGMPKRLVALVAELQLVQDMPRQLPRRVAPARATGRPADDGAAWGGGRRHASYDGPSGGRARAPANGRSGVGFWPALRRSLRPMSASVVHLVQGRGGE